MQRKLFLIAIIVLSLFLVGCESMGSRFDPANKRNTDLLDNAALQHPATSQEPFTIQDNITIIRGTQTTIVQVGFFNVHKRPVLATVSPAVQIGFNDVQTENTITCTDKNKWEYTLKTKAPFLNVSAFESTGFKLTLVDENAIAADQITCPISLTDTESGKVLHTIQAKIMFVAAPQVTEE